MKGFETQNYEKSLFFYYNIIYNVFLILFQLCESIPEANAKYKTYDVFKEKGNHNFYGILRVSNVEDIKHIYMRETTLGGRRE